MTRKFVPGRNAPPLKDSDALNLEISEVVDEIISLLERRRAQTAGAPSSPAAKLSVGHGKASATWQVTDHAQSDGLTPLRDRELKSVHALLAWVANEQGAAHETVQAMTETRFGVQNVARLKQKDYDEVIKFLVDLRIDELRH